MLFGFAAFKDHMSLFPGAGVVANLHRQLEDYKTSKGTIRYTLEKPLPEKLLKQIVAIRQTQIENNSK